MLSGHLYVHVLFTEEVKEARHHLDILDLGDKIELSLSSFRIHQNSNIKPVRQYEREPLLQH